MRSLANGRALLRLMTRFGGISEDRAEGRRLESMTAGGSRRRDETGCGSGCFVFWWRARPSVAVLSAVWTGIHGDPDIAERVVGSLSPSRTASLVVHHRMGPISEGREEEQDFESMTAGGKLTAKSNWARQQRLVCSVAGHAPMSWSCPPFLAGIDGDVAKRCFAISRCR